MGHEPRVRVSALLRWQDRVLLCRQEKPGKEYWLLPGGGVEGGGDADEALRRELGEELGLLGHARSSRARSPSPSRSRPTGRPATATSSTSSSAPTSRTARSRTSRRRTPAIRGARLFSLDELEEIVVHPPMKRFVQRWQPGDPAVYLGSLWAR